MNHVDVYGFGSFFNGSIEYSDIDLLLVHNDRSKESCALAISCKRELRSMLENLHITMLSKQAELSFSFVETARAQHLGRIEVVIDGQSIKKIVASIQAYSMPHIGSENK
ncbi:hypothetical protein [Hydrosulfovibrio ferrireducens]|uniref:hypothetical protein n=1 Tax=Hydrosulfovibrio ferrireducens TaxID=2934181 RepID=UPI003BF78F9C